MSTKTVEGGILALKHSDVVMVTYNLSEQGEKPVLDYALEREKGVLIKKAFASGHACLSGKDPVLECMKLVFHIRPSLQLLLEPLIPFICNRM